MCGHVSSRTSGQSAVGWVKLHDTHIQTSELLGLQDCFPLCVLLFICNLGIIAALETHTMTTLQTLWATGLVYLAASPERRGHQSMT